MRIAVCDDNIRDQEQMAAALRACDPAIRTECFSSGRDLLAAAGKTPPLDLVFLDIYMPEENGVEIAGALRRASPLTGIVFVTTSMDYAVDAFSLDAVHYLVKPVKTADVEEALWRFRERRKKKRPAVVLTSGGVNHTVYPDEISCVRCQGHMKEAVLTDGRTVSTRMPLEELEEKLGGSFLRVSRSCFVNMGQIAQMGTDACILLDGTRIEISRRERVQVRAAYNSYLFAVLGRRGESEEPL